MSGPAPNPDPLPNQPLPAGQVPGAQPNTRRVREPSATGLSAARLPIDVQPDSWTPPTSVPTTGSLIPEPGVAGPPADLPAPLSAIPPPMPVQSKLGAAWRAITTRGRTVALVTAVAVVLGVATGWREWVGISAALAVLLAAAILMALGRWSFVADLDLPRTRFDVDERGWATLLIRNTSGRRMLPLQMELEVHAGFGRAPAEPPPADSAAAATADTGAAPAEALMDTSRTANTRVMSIPSIPGGGSHMVHIPLPTEHRAVVTLGPLRAVRGDVFGLIRRVVQWPIRREVFVRPRIARPTGSLAGFVRDLEGDESARRTASDLSFHTLREYVPGDDRRFIHWKSSARNGTLQVREFLQTHRSMVAVVLSGNHDEYHWAAGDRHDHPADHDRPSTGQRSTGRASTGQRSTGQRGGRPAVDAEFELAVSCAASMVADLVGRRRDVVTDAAGTSIAAATVDGVLDRFCAVDAPPFAPDLAFATRQLLRRNPRASVVILIFGSMTDPAQVRAAFRACPPGASVLALRARVDSSPAPLRLPGSDAGNVVTVPDVDALPGALRIAR
ncbi:MAG: DUF58 domain-containing protein [Nakamurella sp.]